MVWQEWFLVALGAFVLYIGWREAHPAPPEPPELPDYLSAFHYYVVGGWPCHRALIV